VNDVITADGDLVIRHMRDDGADYERIVEWRNRPHVREWWDPDDPPLTVAGWIDELRSSTGEPDRTTVCILEVLGTPIGYLQFYPWDGEQEYLHEVGITLPAGAWGLDIFIGESTLLDQGIGSRAVRLLSDHLFAELSATAVALATEAGNTRAQAAYVRAGMRPVERFLDTDLRDGHRVESILMIRDHPGGIAAER
jgi:RimJ/RimL family protein N-acetyltransferase